MSSIVLSWAMEAPVETPLQRIAFIALSDVTHEFNAWQSIGPSAISALAMKCVCSEPEFLETCYELAELRHISIAYDPDPFLPDECQDFHYYVSAPHPSLLASTTVKAVSDGRRPIPRKVRVSVMERDGYKCVYCGSQKSLCLDHIVAFSKGGGDEEENLQTCCRTCNTRKSNKSHEEFLQWLGAREAAI